MSTKHGPPVLVITSGDPCGIGPEILLKALATPLPQGIRVVIVGDLAVFEETASRLRRRLPRWEAVGPDDRLPRRGSPCLFVDLGHRKRFQPGHSGEAAGEASAAYLDVAVACWRREAVDALVTAPVTKWAIEQARGRFIGQTEYFAEAFGVPFPVMMFVSPSLRVVLATRHVALRQVSGRLTRELMRRTMRVTVDGLRHWFGIRRPRLAVCGINPHAGERGGCGDEERRVLQPILRDVKRSGVRVHGPVAADAFFATLTATGGDGNRYDAVMCWYHDQGLIPFKLLARDEGCQLTLGLPVARTSPHHGSALDIAGKDIAHPGSMRYAIELAATLVKRGMADVHQNRVA